MRSLHEQYIPSNPPHDGEGLSRATWDEFYRISSILGAIQSPAVVSIVSAVSVDIEPTTDYKTLFDSTGTESYNWQQPESQVGSNGKWACPETGVYSLFLNIVIPIDTDPMWNEPVSVGTVRLTTNGGTPETFEYESVSSLPPLITLPLLRPFTLGDEVEIELDLTRGTTSDLVTVTSTLLIKKEGGIK